jgi:hypothetical protein
MRSCPRGPAVGPSRSRPAGLWAPPELARWSSPLLLRACSNRLVGAVRGAAPPCAGIWSSDHDGVQCGRYFPLTPKLHQPTVHGIGRKGTRDDHQPRPSTSRGAGSVSRPIRPAPFPPRSGPLLVQSGGRSVARVVTVPSGAAGRGRRARSVSAALLAIPVRHRPWLGSGSRRVEPPQTGAGRHLAPPPFAGLSVRCG